jgi:uncharacterized protein YkwD
MIYRLPGFRSCRRSYIFILALFVGISSLNAQNGVWDSWDPDVVRELYTSRDISYLNEEEQKIVLFMNLARHDGELFASTFLDAYVEEKQVENTSYLRSLYRDLRKTAGLPPMEVAEDLTAVAQGHARKSGETGHVGHKDMTTRFAHLRGNPYVAWGENCSYGYYEAIEIVLTLLIDEGVEGVGHRKNILNPDFNRVGVAMRPHKRYGINTVMDFGQDPRTDLNSVPF